MQKWLTPPEPDSGPGPGPEEEDEDGYGWDPPGDISTFSGHSSPPLPDEAAIETYNTGAYYSSKEYTYTAYSVDVDGSGLSIGDRAQVEVTVTNTGTEPMWIGYARFFYDTRFISCEPGAKGVWNSDWGAYYLHLPGESSKWTLEIDREITAQDLADGFIMDYAEWRAYPQEYYDGKVTKIYPEDWPYSEEMHLRHPVFVSLAGPCLKCSAPFSPKAVRTDLGWDLSCQVQLMNTGGRLLHNAEADVFLWNKDTDAYTCSDTFPLDDHVFFPEDSGLYVFDYTYGDYKYPVTPWDLENSVDGATRIAFRGRAWTLDGEMFETEITPVEFYPYYVDLWVELAEIPTEQAPENGFVKAKVRVGNDGSDTFSATFIDCPIYDPVADVYYSDDTSEIHGGDLTWLCEGTSQEIEIWIKPTEKELKARKAQRLLQMNFERCIRNGGRSVYADTPKGEVIGYCNTYPSYEWRELEIVIPLLVTETDTAAPTDGPAPTQAPWRDACMRETVGLGDGVAEYTLIYCTPHEDLREATLRALSHDRNGSGKALEAAVGEWREALDAEYGMLLSRVGEESKAAVEAERAAFTELLEARRAMLWLKRPGEGEEIDLRVLEMLMHKVAEMCCERHAAPDAREDSLTAGLTGLEPGQAAWTCDVFTALTPDGERTRETLCADHRDIERRAGELTAAASGTDAEAWRKVKLLWLDALDDDTDESWLTADEAGRAAVAAERAAFGNWLAAREALLEVLWPDRPEVVQEILSRTVRGRVLERCGD